MGFADYAALMAKLDAHREIAEQQFDQIFADKVNGQRRSRRGRRIRPASWVWSSALADDSADEELHRAPRRSRFHRSSRLARTPASVWNSSRYAGLPRAAGERFDIVAQRALEAAQSLEPPERRGDTIARLFDLLEASSRRGAYLALLTEYPAALDRVLSVLGGSRWAAGYLIRHPQLLDELLDDEAIASPFDWPEFKRTLRCAHRRGRWRRTADGPAAPRASG